MKTNLKCLGVGRPAQYERALLVHFDARPTDQELRHIHSLLHELNLHANCKKDNSALTVMQTVLKTQLAFARHELMSSNAALASLAAMPLCRLILKLIMARTRRVYLHKINSFKKFIAGGDYE